jgi:hypothetical protein
MKFPSLRAFTLLVTSAATAVFAGCAAMEAGDTENTLAAAGFRERTPLTNRQQEIYDSMPSYKVQTMTVADQPVYLYKDPKKGVVFYGGQREYDKYKQLSIQQNIANEQLMAAQINQQTALIYGEWGPWGLWY